MSTVDYESTDATGSSNNVTQQLVDATPNIYDTAVQTVFSTSVTVLSPSAEVAGRVVEFTPAAGTYTFSIRAQLSAATPAVTANHANIVAMVVSV